MKGLAIVVSPKAPKLLKREEKADEGESDKSDRDLAIDELASILRVPDDKKAAFADALELFVSCCGESDDESPDTDRY